MDNLVIENAVTTTIDPQQRWQDVFHDLSKLRNLKEDWDGDGAQVPDPEILVSTWHLLVAKWQASIRAPDRVMPTIDGSIIVEWQENDGLIEYEIDEPGSAEVMFTTGNAAPRFEEVRWPEIGPWNFIKGVGQLVLNAAEQSELDHPMRPAYEVSPWPAGTTIRKEAPINAADTPGYRIPGLVEEMGLTAVSVA